MEGVMMERAFAVAVVMVLAVPVSIALTLLAHPAWRRFEEVTGIESFGHSGPAGWCCLLGYGVLAAAAAFMSAGGRSRDREGATLK